MSFFDDMPGWIKTTVTSMSIALSLIVGIIAAEERYVTEEELSDHTKLIHNVMINKELSYALERCATLKEKLRHEPENFQLKMDYDSCVIKREAIKMELKK